MGSLASRERPLSIPPAAADTTQPPLPTQAAASSSFLALALCDFPSGAGVATVLRMGELLRILSDLSPSEWLIPLTCRDGEWWLVVSEVSGKECHIPSSCVAKIRYRWLYEGISRQKAEELLLQPGNRSGSFLIRESQTRQGCYSLSVRRSERASWDSVTHYRIHRLENGWVYISPGLTFPSLHDLVDHYSEFGEGLCCALREPCSMEGARAAPVPAMPAVVKKPSLNWDKIDRGHSPTGGGLSHQPGPEGSHQLLPPGDRDRALQGKERIAKGRALLSHSPSAALVTATNTCGCCGSQAPRGQ
ncbi:src-like-adapter 2 isoform X1 [Falco peregrinus]|uniref:src-like-adapter 2 isoform X1 n=1 Tax=Falco peregrinus TaxID=8954 RepID=UPI00247AA773|nr:src-like-adapter 2 isoform X1 [Falco peregrinus]XP_055670048.1 src-like-adapter 2 isoform X1 [Falco peregrinus]